VIRLNDALLFSSGRAHLDTHALAVVEKVAGIVKSLRNNIRVEGNTGRSAARRWPVRG